jgi:hypothetical protein
MVALCCVVGICRQACVDLIILELKQADKDGSSNDTTLIAGEPELILNLHKQRNLNAGTTHSKTIL